MNNGEGIIAYNPARTLTPIMDLEVAKARLEQFRRFIADYMVDGEDYGEIPGTGVKCECGKNPDCPYCRGTGFKKKKTLLKPGSDKLCELYGLSDSYRIIDRLVDFDRGLFDYEIECTLSRDGFVVATGLGSCSSFEGKYRWRDSKRVCPQCGQETIIKGKSEYGGGWLCFKNKGGCGAKYDDNDPAITEQQLGRIENDDIATLKNTILKMAKKRAKIDATLSATRSSGVFTQDIGDDEGKPKAAKKPVQQPQRKSAVDTINKAQLDALVKAAADAKYPNEAMGKILNACGYADASKIKTKHLETICEFVQGTPLERVDAELNALVAWIKEN